jgi:hypothetical protein
MTTPDLVLVLAVLILACAVPVTILGWGLLVCQRRLQEHNRDLLKGLLSTAAPLAAQNLAHNMEIGDKLVMQNEVAARAARDQRVPREVGR